MTFTRAEIAAMVGPDFELLRSRVNPNLTYPETEAAWNIELIALLAPRVSGFGDDEIRRFWAIYLEEQQTMIDRMAQQVAFNRQMQNTVATTVVRATIWSAILQLFR